MHILLPLLGVLAAFGYWYFMLKNAGKAANEIADMAGRARGAYKRNQFRKKADASVIDAITDPRTAAVVMAVAGSPWKRAGEELAAKYCAFHRRRAAIRAWLLFAASAKLCR